MGKQKKLISRAEARRRLLAKVGGKSQVCSSALDAIETAAEHELACIALENIGTTDKPIKARL